RPARSSSASGSPTRRPDRRGARTWPSPTSRRPVVNSPNAASRSAPSGTSRPPTTGRAAGSRVATRNAAITPASPISPTRTATPGSSRRSATAGRLALGGFRGEQATVERLAHGGGAVTDAELGVDVHQVGLDRGLADEQPGGRFPVG